MPPSACCSHCAGSHTSAIAPESFSIVALRSAGPSGSSGKYVAPLHITANSTTSNCALRGNATAITSPGDIPSSTHCAASCALRCCRLR